MEIITKKGSHFKKGKREPVEGNGITEQILNILVSVEDRFTDFSNIIFYQIPEYKLRMPLRAYQTNSFREIAELIDLTVFKDFYFIKYKSLKKAEAAIDEVQRFINNNY